uniref:Sushi domain-containing protein n=1 Tax=Apteryx owenii TaxID=8824 RepID=A0A8B9PMP3_APTOW
MLQGSHEAECRHDGRWAPPVPVCVPAVPCPPPPVIANATPSAELGENFTSGMSVTYSCDPGFSLIGDASLSCTASGNWSLPYPRCAVLQCPLPPNIDKGKYNSQDLKVFTPGTAVIYSCDPGYYVMGEASIYCTDSGNWSLPLPRCEGGCAAPPGLHFAELTEEYKNQTEFSVGDTVKYTCQPGYMRHPGIPPTVTCLKNQTWSEALEFCKRKQCKYPEAPKNGRVVILTDLLFGSAVNHTCEEGHELVGQSQRRCDIFGTLVAWSGAPPICQKVVCPVPKIQNGRISIHKNSYTYEDTVSFKCHEGFTLQGHHTVQCRADKTWDPPVPVCERGGMAKYYHHPTNTTTKPVVKCLPPPGITNGEHSRHFSDTFDIGALVHYSCKPGFFLIGNESIHCTAYGIWSRPLPRCEVGCVSPGVGNGKVIGLESLYRPGDIVRIECNSDDGPKGLHESQCQAGGTWNPPLPICEGAPHCSKPPEIANGWHSGLATVVFAPGMSVTYSCESDFSLIGTASIYCTEAGAWSHPSPVCQAVKCFHPPNITNGKLIGHISDTFPYGASVSYSCNPGYSLIGNASINCMESGTWGQPLPRCEEIRCVFPEVLGVKKTMMGNTYRLGTNITLECDDGYMLEGISQIQCQEDFSWDPPVPACRLASHQSSSVGLGVAAAVVLLLLGVGIVWKIISKQKEGYYHTYENYGHRTPVDHITEQKYSCVP